MASRQSPKPARRKPAPSPAPAPAAPALSTSANRRAREMDAVKTRILEAARELFARHGYEHVSLRKIAAAMGYTAPALYTHFKDKGELLLEMARLDWGQWAAAFQSLSAIPDPIDRIFQCGRLYVKLATEHPSHYRLMFMTPFPAEITPTEADLALMQNPDTDAYAFIRKAAQDAIDAGLLRPELTDADLVAQTLWAGVHGVASCEITHGEDPCVALRPVDQRTTLINLAILRGLLATPARAEKLLAAEPPKRSAAIKRKGASQ